MGSVCLSTAAILRCESYTRLQNIAIVIPTVLQVFCSTFLLFTNHGNGRRHLWLTAEGLSYFVLVLLEMVSQIFPAVRNNPDAFKVFDRILAATSSVPIFFYTLFIFLLTRAELVDNLPRRLHTPTTLMLFLFVPVVAALNEVASFIGISYSVLFSDSQQLLVAGFLYDGDRVIWVFFTSLALALVTAYQLLNAFLAFYRLVRALINQRRIETSPSEEIHLLKGIGWITGALALGAVETLLGFASGGFGGALTRRVFRFLARALLSIGVARGVDSVEDFELVHQEIIGLSKGREFQLRQFISDPRLSTFRQLTPTATAFHAAPRAPRVSRFYTRPPSQSLASVNSSDSKQSAPLVGDAEKKPIHRVTVNFKNGTPCLSLRFSQLDIPPPVFLAGHFPPRRTSKSSLISYPPASGLLTTPRNRSLLSSLAITEAGQEVKLRSFSSPPSKVLSRANSTSSANFVQSPLNTSTIQDLTSQFPPLPANARQKVEFLSGAKGTDFWDDNAFVTPPSDPEFYERRPPRVPMPSAKHPQVERSSHLDPRGDKTRAKGSPTPRQSLWRLRIPHTPITRTADVPTSAVESPFAAVSGANQIPSAKQFADTDDTLDLGTALATGKSRAFLETSQGLAPGAHFDAVIQAHPRTLPAIDERRGEGLETDLEIVSMRSDSGNKDEAKRSMEPAVEEERRDNQSENRSKRPKLPAEKIMSIGNAPMRPTPVPTRKSYTRGSLHTIPIIIPTKEPTNMEIVQGKFHSVDSRSVLRDSEVLGIEDGSIYRELRERSR